MTGTLHEEMAQDREWREILERLFHDHGALVDDFLERLQGSGSYRDVSISDADLRLAASETLELLIRRLAGLPLSAQLQAAPERLGIRRARQGVLREALMDAVRLDFRVLWAGLVRASGDTSAELLVRYAEHVLSTVEQYSGDVQAAFLDEQAALARDSRAQVDQAVTRLLHAGAQVQEVAGEVADILRLPLHGTFEVAFVASAAVSARRQSRGAGRERFVVTADLDEGTVFIRRQDHAAPWNPEVTDAGGGLVRAVAGIAGLPEAIVLAARLAHHAPSGQLVEQEDVWLAVLRDEAGEALPLIVGTAAALAEVDDELRRRLLDTVLLYCTTGSIKQTAERLFCHRNTIINRLRQFQEITDCDVTVPLQAARVLVAFGDDPILAVLAAGAGPHPGSDDGTAEDPPDAGRFAASSPTVGVPVPDA